MIADLLKESDTYEQEAQAKLRKPSPRPPYTVHTLMGDMRRWFEGDTIDYRDYRVDKAKYLLLQEMYDEWKNGKEGNYDNNRVD